MASLIGWKHEYSIDGGKIDAQHKHLVELANKVLATSDPVTDVTQLRKTVKDLFQYIEYHFDAEEEFMREVEYPEVEEHHEIHAQLVHDMNHLLKASKDYNQLLAELKPIMTSWVLKHILVEDGKIGKFLKGKEVKAG